MWYTACLLFKAVHSGEPNSESLWEETFILIDAETETVARTMAEELGRNREHGYPTDHGNTVKWQFMRVERVYAIDVGDLQTGTEVFSRFLRQSEVESLLRPFEDNE